ACGLVVSKLSGKEEVVFGTVLFGRMHGGAGAESGMGVFINTLPVRMGAGAGAEASVRGVHGQLSELMLHEHASLALAQKCSGVAAPLPLFNTLLNYRHSGGVGKRGPAETEQAWQGIRMMKVEERSNYPLTISVDDLGERYVLTVKAESSIEPERVCQYMSRAMESLLTALEAETDRSIGSLKILPEEERAQGLYGWNATEVEHTREKGVQELFEQQVRKTPEAIAVVYGESSLSYEELNRRANRLGRYLRELGVKPDARVAICAERSLEMVVALLGVLKAGGAYVPLDPGYPVERLRYMLEDSVPMALLTQNNFEELFPGLCDRLPVVKLEDTESGLQKYAETNLDSVVNELAPRHLAYVIYTSGSTGRPKGVMNEHRGLVNLLTWMQRAYRLGLQDALLQKASFSFDASIPELFWPLITGARLVMASAGRHQDPGYFCETIERNNITTVKFVPSMLQAFLEHADSGRCSTLTQVQCAG